jgi:heme-degrading monooxygenase HmoA
VDAVQERRSDQALSGLSVTAPAFHGIEAEQAEATEMFSVVFEVHPREGALELYLSLARDLKPILERMDGFIDNERFESRRRPGWILSHSTWRDEKSVVRWRTLEKHHETQQRGREQVFQDYHLRVGEIILDTAPPVGVSLVEQRLDPTEVGTAKFVTLTELQLKTEAQTSVAIAELPDLLSLDCNHRELVDHDVFASIYNRGKLALLASWRDRRSAEQFAPRLAADIGTIRHRAVRVVRDYSMFDRRESPQYYPAIQEGRTGGIDPA